MTQKQLDVNLREKPRFPLYLHLNSADAFIHIDDFGLDLKNYLCGLISINGKILLDKDENNSSNDEKSLYLCSDLCGNMSILNKGLRLPVLREIIFKENESTIDSSAYSKVLWIETSDVVIHKIHLYIRNGLGETPSLKHCSLNCTLFIFPKYE